MTVQLTDDAEDREKEKERERRNLEKVVSKLEYYQINYFGLLLQ
mgnify:CR=1